jgi:type IV pilus assembly protein PilM
MKPSLLDEAIRRAAKKEISLPLDELYLSWQVMPGRGDEQTYFVLGVPRHFVDALANTLKIAGIEPYLMDLQPLALARTAGRDAIVVNLEPDCFDIVFVAGGVPAVIHSISPRGEGATLEDNIMRLADELTKTAAFYESRHPESPLQPSMPLLLTGDLMLVTPARGLLQSEVKYPVEPLVAPLEYPPELPAPSYSVNMGLALKKIKAPANEEEARFHDINVNIFTDKYRKIKAKPTPAGYMLAQVFLAIVIVILYPLYQSLDKLKDDNTMLQTEFINTSREFSLTTLFAEEDARTENEIAQVNAATAALLASDQSALANRGIFTSDLEMVTGALPPSAYLTSIDNDSTAVTMRGETGDVFTVVDYAVALELTGAFTDVRITELGEITKTLTGDDATNGELTTFSLIAFDITLKK